MFASSRTLLFVCGLAAALALAVPRLSSGAAVEEPYVVRAGDTLWALAEKRYGGDPREGVWRIRERNDLGGGDLLPGTVLYLPARAGDAAG
ncbi:MAG TPA: LysM peptidoglycan-binding domain-containing protein [Gaiellaceae bacterium]|nr:LysM peptidoglycan-binding domain-containing protein [Gaiellaceae bacterium]